MRTSPPCTQWLARLDIGTINSTKSKRKVPSISHLTFQAREGAGWCDGGLVKLGIVVVIPHCCHRCSPFVVVVVLIHWCHCPHSLLVVSTHDPPHKQWLMRLEVGAVSVLPPLHQRKPLLHSSKQWLAV